MPHAAALTPTLATEMIGCAARAPSSHNTQPWRFVATEASIEMWADRQRVLAFNDPHHRELTISCGCALFNLRIAAEERGLWAHTTLMPDAAKADLLARVQFSALTGAHPRIDLAAAIDKRHTYRKPYLPTAIAPSDIVDLAQHAAIEHAQLHHFEDQRVRKHVESLAVQADTMQWSDPGWRRALAQWMRSRKDGELHTVSALALPVIRDVGPGAVAARPNADGALISPIVLMIATQFDTPMDWLAAGQALQRVLLAAAMHGLQASYLNQAIQTSSTRSKMAALTAGECCPQVLFQLGVPARDVATTARRDLAETMQWTSPAVH